jgi:hypothetical protein
VEHGHSKKKSKDKKQNFPSTNAVKDRKFNQAAF